MGAPAEPHARKMGRAVVVLALSAGCAPAPTTIAGATTSWIAREVAPSHTPTTAEWRAGLDRLKAIRREAAIARTARIALELTEPRSGRRLAARGAVAVAPPRALRMILLGPGGTTALDLWMSGDRYRFAVPAIDLDKRGALTSPRVERRGLPVDFLGWWLLRPAAGELLHHARVARADRFVLRDGSAIVDLVVGDDGRVDARRTTWVGSERVDEETVRADRLGCGEVRYHQGSTMLDVIVRCEGETRGEPKERALAEPSGEGGS